MSWKGDVSIQPGLWPSTEDFTLTRFEIEVAEETTTPTASKRVIRINAFILSRFGVLVCVKVTGVAEPESSVSLIGKAWSFIGKARFHWRSRHMRKGRGVYEDEEVSESHSSKHDCPQQVKVVRTHRTIRDHKVLIKRSVCH